MNRYDRDKSCIKCGHHPAFIQHHGLVPLDGLFMPRCMAVVFPKKVTGANGEEMMWLPEHIHRTCPNCGYEWAEEPLNEEEH